MISTKRTLIAAGMMAAKRNADASLLLAPRRFTVFCSRLVERVMRRLDATTVRRVDAAILALADDPRPFKCKKLSGRPNLWRIRVGRYRVVYEIRGRQVIVIAVAHRREVYRGL